MLPGRDARCRWHIRVEPRKSIKDCGDASATFASTFSRCSSAADVFGPQKKLLLTADRDGGFAQTSCIVMHRDVFTKGHSFERWQESKLHTKNLPPSLASPTDDAFARTNDIPNSLNVYQCQINPSMDDVQGIGSLWSLMPHTRVHRLLNEFVELGGWAGACCSVFGT